MKAHIVTHNLFSHTFDHAVNGNTLFFIKIFFSLYFGYFFIYNRACASNIGVIRNLLDWGFLIFAVNYPYL